MAQLIWEDKVLSQIVEVAEYIFENYGQSTADKFVQTLLQQSRRLLQFPESGRPSRHDNQIRFILVGKNKRHRLYYEIRNKNIVFIYLFDTKQSTSNDPFQ